jgi:hypothetical protein
VVLVTLGGYFSSRDCFYIYRNKYGTRALSSLRHFFALLCMRSAPLFSKVRPRPPYYCVFISQG